MKGIVKMDGKGNPSIVLPGVELKMVGPIADKFQGLPQKFADEIEVTFWSAPSVSQSEFRIKLDLSGASSDYAQKEKTPEAATSSGTRKGTENSTETVNPDDPNVKEVCK
jgi:hypothetical protein